MGSVLLFLGAPNPDEEESDFKMSAVEYQAIGSCLKPYLKDIIGAFDLSMFKTVVDLGGEIIGNQ